MCSDIVPALPVDNSVGGAMGWLGGPCRALSRLCPIDASAPIDVPFVVNLTFLAYHQPSFPSPFSTPILQMADAASGSADKSVQVKLVLLGTSPSLFFY